MTARFQSTLPRRERPSSFSAGTTILYFNPRSREGSDFTLQKKFLYTLTFQSTLPRRERPQELFHLVNLRNFNPRSREGSDNCKVGLSWWCNISIHAPAKGATDYACEQAKRSSISIHAPAKGATDKNDLALFERIFQSTLPRRERP